MTLFDRVTETIPYVALAGGALCVALAFVLAIYAIVTDLKKKRRAA